MVTLANAFIAMGHPVDLLTYSKTENSYRELSAKVRLITADRWGIRPRALEFLWTCYRYCRNDRPAALLSTARPLNVIAILAGRLAGTPVTVREVNTEGERLRLRRRPRDRMYHWLARVLYPHAHCIVAPSQGVADDIAQHLPRCAGKLKTIQNPLDLAHIESDALLPTSHPWFADNRELPVIVGIGRLVDVKKFDDMIRAFAVLRQTTPCRLAIIGEGGEMMSLHALIRDLGLEKDAALLGYQSNPFQYLARADLAAFTSALEGLPNGLIQAIACGTPVVATDCPSGPREILEGGQWGALVPVGDIDAIAAAMGQALKRPVAAGDALKARGRYYSVDTVAPLFLQAMGL